MGKPLPPEPDIRLRTRVGWWVWSHLTWPWEVRKLKAAGFRRTGWMAWETGPELRAWITDEILTLPPDADWTPIGNGMAVAPPGTPPPDLPWTPEAGPVKYADPERPTLTEFLEQTHRPDPFDDPDVIDRFFDALLTPPAPAGPERDTLPGLGYPWDDPHRDVLADIRDLLGRAREAGQAPLPPRRKLHCAGDIAEALRCSSGPIGYTPPPLHVTAWMLGVDVVYERDWEPGRWELREDDIVINHGWVEDL
jgi:hypothetical protein